NVSNLLESCCSAIQELANEPFVGRTSYARVMGLAMEILRRDYSQDAPKGWVPVMKILREDSKPSLDSPVRQGAGSIATSSEENLDWIVYEKEKRAAWVREVSDPNMVFEHGPSPICWVRPTIERELTDFAQVKAIFLWTAARRGMAPDHIGDAVPFLEDI